MVRREVPEGVAAAGAEVEEGEEAAFDEFIAGERRADLRGFFGVRVVERVVESGLGSLCAYAICVGFGDLNEGEALL
jgi:hypothetical protein